MKQTTISILAYARANVEVAYETSQTFDPSVTGLLAEIHKKHKQPRQKRRRSSKKIFKQPLVELQLSEKNTLPTTITITVPRVRIVTVVDKTTGWSRIITLRTVVEQQVPNKLTLSNMIMLTGFMVNYAEKVEPYLAEQTEAFDLRTRQTYRKPQFPIPVNTKTAIFPNKIHSWWLALPEVLRHASVIEPPKFIAVESDFEKPSRAKNPDIPDNLAFDVMRIQDRVNEHLDYRAMDDRHFRESCVQVGTGIERKNIFLEPKNGHSKHIIKNEKGELVTVVRGRTTKPQTFLDPQWLMAKLACPFEMAFELKEAFKRLDITTWHRASKIINGVTGTGKITIPFARWDDDVKQYVAQYATKLKGVRISYTEGRLVDGLLPTTERQLSRKVAKYGPPNVVGRTTSHIVPQSGRGLTSYAPQNSKGELLGPPDLRGLEYAIQYIAKLARELEDVTVEWDGMINLDLNEDAPGVNDDPLWAGVELSPEEVPFIIDDLDQLGGESNPFTGHALAGDGTDGLPSELIGCLKTATDFNLANIAKRVRPYWTNEGSDEEPRWIPPNRGMSDEQVSQMWAYWQARRAKIKSSLATNPEVARYLSNLCALTTRNQAAAYIYALRDGKRFAERGTELHTAGIRVIPSALKLLWDEFNRMFAKVETTPQVAVAVGMDIPY